MRDRTVQTLEEPFRGSLADEGHSEKCELEGDQRCALGQLETFQIYARSLRPVRIHDVKYKAHFALRPFPIATAGGDAAERSLRVDRLPGLQPGHLQRL